MQPSMVGLFAAEWQQFVLGLFTSTAAEAAARRRARRIAVQPFGDAAGEGAGFGGREPTLEVGDCRPLVEQSPPILARPAVAAGAQQRDHARLVVRKQLQHGRRRRGLGVQREGIAIDADPNAGIARRLQGSGGAHSRALQPAFSAAGWSGWLASAPSASAWGLEISGLARTVAPVWPAEPSANSPTVRRPAEPKPLPELAFGRSAGGADDADGCAPRFSGEAGL